MKIINPLTNRPIKVGGRVYREMLRGGWVEHNGTMIIPRYVRIFSIEGLPNRTVEQESKEYDRLIELGYTPIINDETGENILMIPQPNSITETFNEDISTLSESVMGRVGNRELFNYLISLNTATVNGVNVKNMTFKQYRKYLEDLLYTYYFEGYDDDPDLRHFFTITIVWTNRDLAPHGPLFDGDKNCVIKLIDDHFKNQGKEDLTRELIDKLYQDFENGVYHHDFDLLASKIKSKIIVFTPFGKKEYGCNNTWRQLALHVNNNHALLQTNKEIFNRPIIFVDNILDVFDSVKNEITDYIHGVALFTKTNVYRNTFIKTDENVYDVDKLNKQFGINFFSETSYYLKRFLIDNPKLIEISQFHKNIEAIKSICKHGIHYTTENNERGNNNKIETFDLKQAYTNFYKWPIYEGMPTDLDICINENACNDSILEYAGFALIEYIDLYNRHNVIRWVSFPYIKMLKRQNRLYKYKYALISRNRTDLNLSVFQNTPKRQWHKVLGRMNAKTSKKTFTTFDPLIAYGGGRWDRTHIESPPGSGKFHDIFQGHKFSDTPNSHYFPHIAGYIQAYSEIMIEEIAFNSIGLGNQLVSVIVDEIRIQTNSNNSNAFLNLLDKEFWHTDKESHASNSNSPVYYPLSIQPVKHSNRFNPILQNKGNNVKITGGAGVGKSYTASEIQNQMDIKILTPTHDSGQIYLDKGIEYTTVAKQISMVGGNVDNLLIDECSMVSQETLDIIQKKLPKLTLLVGDDKQLLPVDGSMINDDNFIVIELSTIYRQSGDPEFARKLNILRLDCNTTEKFGTDIDEKRSIEICKNGGIIASALNSRVARFNKICNGGDDFKEGSRVRFNKNKRTKGYYNGLLGVIVKSEDTKNPGLIIRTKKMDFDLSTHKKFIELAYSLTVHKLQGKTLDQPLIYDSKIHTTFKNIKYTAYSRVISESLLYILK